MGWWGKSGLTQTEVRPFPWCHTQLASQNRFGNCADSNDGVLTLERGCCYPVKLFYKYSSAAGEAGGLDCNE